MERSRASSRESQKRRRSRSRSRDSRRRQRRESRRQRSRSRYRSKRRRRDNDDDTVRRRERRHRSRSLSQDSDNTATPNKHSRVCHIVQSTHASPTMASYYKQEDTDERSSYFYVDTLSPHHNTTTAGATDDARQRQQHARSLSTSSSCITSGAQSDSDVCAENPTVHSDHHAFSAKQHERNSLASSYQYRDEIVVESTLLSSKTLDVQDYGQNHLQQEEDRATSRHLTKWATHDQCDLIASISSYSPLSESSSPLATHSICLVPLQSAAIFGGVVSTLMYYHVEVDISPEEKQMLIGSPEEWRTRMQSLACRTKRRANFKTDDNNEEDDRHIDRSTQLIRLHLDDIPRVIKHYPKNGDNGYSAQSSQCSFRVRRFAKGSANARQHSFLNATASARFGGRGGRGGGGRFNHRIFDPKMHNLETSLPLRTVGTAARGEGGAGERDSVLRRCGFERGVFAVPATAMLPMLDKAEAVKRDSVNFVQSQNHSVFLYLVEQCGSSEHGLTMDEVPTVLIHETQQEEVARSTEWANSGGDVDGGPVSGFLACVPAVAIRACLQTRSTPSTTAPRLDTTTTSTGRQPQQRRRYNAPDHSRVPHHSKHPPPYYSTTQQHNTKMDSKNDDNDDVCFLGSSKPLSTQQALSVLTTPLKGFAQAALCSHMERHDWGHSAGDYTAVWVTKVSRYDVPHQQHNKVFDRCEWLLGDAPRTLPLGREGTGHQQPYVLVECVVPATVDVSGAIVVHSVRLESNELANNRLQAVTEHAVVTLRMVLPASFVYIASAVLQVAAGSWSDVVTAPMATTTTITNDNVIDATLSRGEKLQRLLLGGPEVSMPDIAFAPVVPPTPHTEFHSSDVINDMEQLSQFRSKPTPQQYRQQRRYDRGGGGGGAGSTTLGGIGTAPQPTSSSSSVVTSVDNNSRIDSHGTSAPSHVQLMSTEREEEETIKALARMARMNGVPQLHESMLSNHTSRHGSGGGRHDGKRKRPRELEGGPLTMD